MKINPTIFREYDIRGVVDKEFGVHDAYLIGRGYGTTVKRAGGNSIVVGYDGRLTSVELEKALVQEPLLSDMASEEEVDALLKLALKLEGC